MIIDIDVYRTIIDILLNFKDFLLNKLLLAKVCKVPNIRVI